MVSPKTHTAAASDHNSKRLKYIGQAAKTVQHVLIRIAASFAYLYPESVYVVL
nr:hypothetical protein [Buzura suppressaria nucleopolyhedrovirus]